MTKQLCMECGWRGRESDVLRAPDPFSEDETDQIIGCPQCREANTMTVACDEPDCWERATCGTPTAKRYRQTCGEHRPRT